MRTNLNGVTLLRYAHCYRDRTSGGVEQYLNQLNRGLLAKYDMTILQMHLVEGDTRACSTVTEACGRGRIIWIPVPIFNGPRSLGDMTRRLRQIAAVHSSRVVVETDTPPAVARSMISTAVLNSLGHLRYSGMILSEVLVPFLDSHKVDLLAMHWLNYDVGPLLSAAVRRRIPFAIINHFDNQRLGFPRNRRWIEAAAGVGGISEKNIPPELRDYVNLSDAIDIDFFSPRMARPVTRPPGVVVLLPARITRGKGHRDLVLAAQSLVKTGKNLSLVFAGTMETGSAPLKADLDELISRDGLETRVVFLGQLTSAELRDWYGACDVVVLPSHSEGLGRVLLEAQAMEKPVIAYDNGGMPDAIRAGKTGFLVKTGDYRALADAICVLLNDAGRRLEMGQAGRQFVAQRFSVPMLIARHTDFYLTAAGSATKRSTHA